MENNNSRRDFLKKSIALTLGAVATTSVVNNVVAANTFLEKESLLAEGGKYTLPALPYAVDALEPHIDKMTMEIHHGKHHQAYVNNLNKALEGANSDLLSKTSSLETIFENVTTLSPAIRNNAGGHYNHSLFWTLMKPATGGATEPTGKLASAIKTTFGSFDEFKKQFSDAASKRFGSGWAWLVVSNGKLMITSTQNQDNPLMKLDSIEIKGTPILGLDVWEHAYYLKYQNKRVDYINTWWNIVNWEAAEKLFEKTLK